MVNAQGLNPIAKLVVCAALILIEGPIISKTQERYEMVDVADAGPITLHFIWLGQLSEVIITYLKIWRKINPDYRKVKIKLWTDQSASVAQFLKKEIEDNVEAETRYNPNFQPNLKAGKRALGSIIEDKLWEKVKEQLAKSKAVTEFSINNAVEDAVKELELDIELGDFEDRCKRSFLVIPDEYHVDVEQINTLWNSEELFKYYAQELVLRQNSAAASDLVRLRILYDEGGLYLDTDLLPGLNPSKVYTALDRSWGSSWEIIEGQRITQALLENVHLKVTNLKGRQRKVLQNKYNDYLEGYSGKDRLRRETGKNNILEWFVPIESIKVPRIAGCAMARDTNIRHGGMPTNAAIAAVAGSKGIAMAERDIMTNYRYLEKAGLLSTTWEHRELTLSDWEYVLAYIPESENKPQKMAQLKSKEFALRTYRSDGHEVGSVVTTEVSGPIAVSDAFLRALGEGSRLDDIVLSSTLYNKHTEEDDQSTWQLQTASNDKNNNDPTVDHAHSSLQIKEKETSKRYIGIKNKYRYVLRMGSSPQEKNAVDALVLKANRNLKGKVQIGVYDDSTKSFLDTAGQAILARFADRTDVAIVGHGGMLNVEVRADQTISGVSPVDLAVALGNTLRPALPRYTKINKISIIACNLERKPTHRNWDFMKVILNDGFSKRFLAKLDRKLYPSKLTVCSGLVQVDQLGYRHYAVLQPPFADQLKWQRKFPSWASPKILITSKMNKWFARPVSIDHENVLIRSLDIKKTGALHTTTHTMRSRIATSHRMLHRKIFTDLHANKYNHDKVKAAFITDIASGSIIVEPSSMAILNAMRNSEHRIIVASSSTRLLEGSRIALNILAESQSTSEGMKQLYELDPEFALDLENTIKPLQSHLAFHRIRERRSKGEIVFVPVDFTAPGASDYLLSFVEPNEQVAAVYVPSEPSESTVGPAGQHLTRQMQEGIVSTTLESCTTYYTKFVFYTDSRRDGAPKVMQGTFEKCRTNLAKTLDYTNTRFSFFDVLDAQLITDDLVRATREVRLRTGLSSDSVPVLETAERGLITFMNSEGHSSRIKAFPSMEDNNAFLRAKRAINIKYQTMSKGFRYSSGQLIQRPETEVEPVHSLNAAFFLMALRHVIQRKGVFNDTGIAELDNAISTQVWVNLIGAGFSFGQDASNVVKLLSNSVSHGTIQSIKSTTSGLSRALQRASGVGSGIAGFLLNAANVGFDIYELMHSTPQSGEAVFATQLSIDVTSLALAGGAVFAGAIGMTSVAATLGALSVPLAGIGIGLTALASEFARISNDAAGIGSYFHDLDQSFRQAYTSTEHALVPRAASVIKEINFRTKKIKMGSPMLSRTKHGYSGSGKLGMFLLPWHHPKNDRVRPVFDVRERLGHPAEQVLIADKAVIVLPIAPASTMGSFVWNLLPFSTKRYDRGFNVLRRLEQNNDFDFDFWIFPFHKVIQKMSMHFYKTIVTVILDDKMRTLIVPEHNGQTANKLTYHIIGSTNQTIIQLRPNAHVKLEGPETAFFALDVSEISTSTGLERRGSYVVVAGQRVDVSGLNSEHICVHAKDNAVKCYILSTGEELQQAVEASRLRHINGLKTLVNHQSDLNEIAVRFWNETVCWSVEDAIYNNATQRDEYILLNEDDITWLTNTKTDELWFKNSTSSKIVYLNVAGTLLENGEVLSVESLSDAWVISDRVTNQLGSNSVTYFRYLFDGKTTNISSVSVEFDGIAHYHVIVDTDKLFRWVLHFGKANNIQLSSLVDIKTIEHNELGAVLCTMRKWILTNTGQTVMLDSSMVFSDALMRLAIMPELSMSTNKNDRFRAMLYDPWEQLIYRYTSNKDGTSPVMQILKRDIRQVNLEGDTYIGATSIGEVVSLPFDGNGTMVGLTREGLHFYGPKWWEALRVRFSYSDSTNPLSLYGVYEEVHGNLYPTLIVDDHVRAWYIPQFKKFAVVDPKLLKDEDFWFLDYLTDGSGALIRTSTGGIKIVQLIQNGSDVFTPEGELKKNGSYSALDVWRPALALGDIKEAKRLQGLLTLETETGIIVTADNTKNDSATFVLTGLHLNEGYTFVMLRDYARDMPIKYPAEDFVPAWEDSKRGWVYTLNDSVGPFFVSASKVRGTPVGTDVDGTLLWVFNPNHEQFESCHEEYQGFVRKYVKTHFESVTRYGDSIAAVAKAVEKEKDVRFPNIRGITAITFRFSEYTEQFYPNVTDRNIKQIGIDLSGTGSFDFSNGAHNVKPTTYLKPWMHDDCHFRRYLSDVVVFNNRTKQVVYIRNFNFLTRIIVVDNNGVSKSWGEEQLMNNDDFY